MSAGCAAKMNWIVPIIHRPVIRLRTSRSAIPFDSSVNRPARSSPRPIVLPSMIPETDSDSATSADRSARRFCCCEVIRRRILPTRWVIQTLGGTNTSENSARRQSSRHMATSDATTVVTLDAIVVAVVVTTLSSPPMSLAIRDWISPVRVRVKNASDIRCRCR